MIPRYGYFYPPGPRLYLDHGYLWEQLRSFTTFLHVGWTIQLSDRAQARLQGRTSGGKRHALRSPTEESSCRASSDYIRSGGEPPLTSIWRTREIFAIDKQTYRSRRTRTHKLIAVTKSTITISTLFVLHSLPYIKTLALPRKELGLGLTSIGPTLPRAILSRETTVV